VAVVKEVVEVKRGLRRLRSSSVPTPYLASDAKYGIGAMSEPRIEGAAD
jgi:hypothetical protein